MSIIIRLQNLPWAANSVDIRRYFAGLSIPEGGVHIVGGEMGDAFIAFSTDEDARQAMERDGGKIKDMKIKLLLSSRSEMTRVIEQARSQNLSLHVPSAVKAAVNDSDRRRQRSPSPRRRDRDKSPARDRRRLSSRRDHSRSRSRSPRRSRDYDREMDYRSSDSRAKRDDRHFEDSQRYREDRYRSPRDSRDREVLPERKPLHPRSMNESMGTDTDRGFDPRVGSTPQSYDNRLMEGARSGVSFGPRQGSIAGGSVPYYDNRGQPQPVSEAPYLFPAAMHSASLQAETRKAVEPIQPPPGFPMSGSFPGNFNRAASNELEAKRPSPTPATSAPNVESNTPYSKGYGTAGYSNLYGTVANQSNLTYSSSASTTMGTLHSNSQIGERGNAAAASYMQKNYDSGGSQAAYGAEPYAKYEKIPEANQAGMPPNVSCPREIADQEASSYSRQFPSNLPSTSLGSNIPQKSHQRGYYDSDRLSAEDKHYAPAQEGNRFQQSGSDQFHSPAGNRFEGANIPGKDFQSSGYDRQMGNKGGGSVPKGDVSGYGDRLYQASESQWSQTWNEARRGLLNTPEVKNDSADFYGTTPMQLDDDDVPEAAPPPTQAYNVPRAERGAVLDRPRNSGNQMLLQQRDDFQQKPENLPDSRFSNARNRVPRRPLMSEPTPQSAKCEPQSCSVPKQGPPQLTVEVRGLPFDACEADILELFRGIFIPPENIRLECDEHGKPTGIAYVKFSNIRDYEEGLSRNGADIGNCFPRVAPCPLSDFENCPFKPAQLPPKSGDVHEPPKRSLEPTPPARTNLNRPKTTHDSHLSSNPPSQQNSNRPPAQHNVSRELQQPAPTRHGVEQHQSSAGEDNRSERLVSGINIPKSEPSPREAPKPRALPRDGSHLQNHPCEEDLCVQLQGLPYSCKEEDIVNFFDGLSILDIFIKYLPNGKASGLGYVEFATQADFQSALAMDRKKIAHRFIEVTVASKNMMNAAQNQKPPPRKKALLDPPPVAEHLPKPGAPLLDSPPVKPLVNRPGATNTLLQDETVYCIAMRGVPRIVKNHDIADFFGEIGVVPHAIHIMLDTNKMPSGQAFAEFLDRRQFEDSLKKDGHMLCGSRVSVKRITYQEMCNVLGGPPKKSGPLLETPPHPEEGPAPPPRKALMPLPTGENAEVGPSAESMPQADIRPRFSYNDGPRGPRPPNRMKAPSASVQRNPGPPAGRPSYGPRGPGGYRPRHTGPPPQAQDAPADFGMPGCVVAVSNLHFRAGLEELLELFHNFPLDKDSIIRKYTDSGQPTGDARIAFRSREEAVRAVREMNKKPIMGRPLYLSLV